MERIKLLGETIKEYLLVVSFLGGGYWAVHTFYISERLNINPKPILEADIKVSPIVINGDKYLKSLVTVSNKGNDPVWIELATPSLSLRAIKIDSSNNLETKLLSKQRYQGYVENNMSVYGDIDELEISENSKFDLSYISKINNTNFPTLVTFMATFRHKLLREGLEERGYSKATVFTIQANDYVYY